MTGYELRPSQQRRERARQLARRLRYPPGHWRLLAFCLVIVLAVILFEGFVTHTIGPSSEPTPQRGAPAPLLGQRPILNATGSTLASRQPSPGRRIALTFDDGPDPKWTPKIAAVLRRYGVPGTFFVVGSQGARHRDLLRSLVADGNELGNHTFTHASLSSGPLWQRRSQLDLTEGVIVGATGHFTRLVRPPYSATSDAIDPRQERELASVAGKRYLIVLTDYDSKDWERRGVASIVRNATPKAGRGGVIMFHDGGGDRSETAAALAQLIPQLQARGFRFVTVSNLAGLPQSSTHPLAPVAERTRGQIFTWSVGLAFFLTTLFSILILAVGVLMGLRALLLLTLASHQTRAYRRRVIGEEYLPSVSVLVPAFNEEVGIARAVTSLAESDYPDLEVVVVDDGSTDATAEIVEALNLDRVHLIRQDNGGKPAALNTGIRMSSGDVLVMVDGDTVFEPGALRHLVQPLADPQVAAVSGNTKVGNRSRMLGRWQHIEYVTGFNLDRRMYEVLQCTPTVPGAIGAFRRDTLAKVGGMSGDTLAEDTDLTLAIGRTGMRVVYAPDARAWTEAPSTLTGLWRQRYRWSFGTMQAVWKHRGAITSRDPLDRRIGRRALPYMIFFQILLPILAPLIDLFALYGVIFEDPARTLAFWGAFNVLQLLIAAYGFRLDRESLKPLWAMPLQQFVYRQLMYLVIIESTISALIGVRAHWQHIPRTGDVEVEVVSA
jgi:cellulose synthase/poly-beta-1,6-N-acetylglucosamine synthase-like glycosyltransferase/peptidoglycan/xylan/chitin deacetylase (PgdA/CDA1 family)